MDNLYSHQQLLGQGQFDPDDLQLINQRRRPRNRLGFAYQLAFVRLYNRFPVQSPAFEVDEALLMFVSIQLGLDTNLIQAYTSRQPTLSEHQEQIREYGQLTRFEDDGEERLQTFIFEEACRLEQTNTLLTRAQQFLRENSILQPADYTLHRLIINQRQAARQYIFDKISGSLASDFRNELDAVLVAKDHRLTPFQWLKKPPGQASPAAFLRLVDKLEHIQATGILSIDLSWLNNNYQRSMTRYARRCSAARLRNLQANHRYAVLVCFLWQTYQDTIDYIIDMHDKIITGVYKRAQTEMDEETKRRRRMIRTSLMSFRSLGRVVLDESVNDSDLRQVLFSHVNKEVLATQVANVDVWLDGKYSHVFRLVMQRFTYLRQFAPALLASLEYRSADDQSSALATGIQLLQELNDAKKRKLPDDAPLGFISKTIRPFVEADDGTVSKRAWECALLTAIRDDIRAGNIFVQKSKRFGRFDNFFISDATWQTMRAGFFERAGLPEKATDVQTYLTERLNLAYDNFLESLPQNTYAQVDEDGWHLSTDPGEKLDADSKKRLDELQYWLSDNMRTIKLPELLIEVDNELQFTRPFMTPAQQETRTADQVCTTLATIMAHGCNIGPFTMARLTEGVTYTQIKQITDWQLTEEAQKQALAQLVKAISRLDVTQAWGEGKTSSSDGQRFRLRSKVLQRTYSHKLNDYALEFYYFVADNYAPFYSTAIECKDRDAAYVLDGLLYNESDLALEEHYTDTHGYTEINFAAFAMLGRRFSPRIRGIQKQRIYRIDQDKDYGALTPLVKPRDRIIHLSWVTDQWDRMGHFYASLESGHTTASTGLKRLVGYSGKNHFYRANRELGRVFKTEHVLRVMSDPLARQQMRRGLLKSEEMNALARQVGYGKQGTLTTRELEEQKNTSSCLTLIMACVIYWQAKEINRVILECDPEGTGIDLSLLEHISPIGWDNVLLYGEYVLNRSLVKEQNVIS